MRRGVGVLVTRAPAGRRQIALPALIVTAALLVTAAAVATRSDPSGAGGTSGQAGSRATAGGRADGTVDVRASVAYGLVEPAVALPGAETASDRDAWSRIRADIVGSGACWLRTDLNSWLARALDAFGWLGTPLACSASSGSPVKVLAILDDQTIWDARVLCPTTAFSAAFRAHKADFTPDDWRSLVRCVAGRYAGRISAYEIWNEPLLQNSMFGYEDGSAGHYFDLLRIADLEIKAADPNATVIALGGSDIFAGGDRARLTAMRGFTDDLLALGAAGYADAVSLHAYPWGRHDEAVWDSYRAELRFQAEAWKKPVWITETGQRASDAWTQSAYLDAAYDLFVQAGVRHIFWFSITDQRDGDFGLRGRPVESAMRTFALAHPTG